MTLSLRRLARPIPGLEVDSFDEADAGASVPPPGLRP
jgi:hypothetical protein